MFHVLDQFVILPRSAVSEEASACRSEDDRWYGRGWSHQQRDKEDFQRVREIIDINQKKNRAQNSTLRNSSLDRKRV